MRLLRCFLRSLLPCLLASSVCFAQGTRKDDIVFNSRGVPLAGATIRVCAMPATGQPCTPLANIYSDAALTQAMANPTTTDGLGNYFFYAAPGKYEIEISGPGITTKQIPNVILPSDPSSPTFNNLSTTGNITAFSLNLSGNLTVNGNTTVVGNLASGTLNLANQSVAPGPASAGTVNLYTKADKRLYYQDDTGTEIGPIANTSGAQTNVSNTFTAAQNFDADVHAKGPNPWFDLLRFGGYTSTLPVPQTTGSMTAGSATLAIASALDFANGQGIVVWGAGSLPTITTPPQPAVTPIGILNGSTTYNYKVIAEDYFGGLTSASAAGTTTTGAATIGVNTVTLTQAVRSGGVTTYTTSVAHNFQAGQSVDICGFGGGTGCPGTFINSFNGVKVIVSTPTSTTFTVNDGGMQDATDTSGTPFAQVAACNKLTFTGFSGTGTLRYWIYRSVGAGAYSLVGVAVGLDPFFIDCNQNVTGAPGYVPSTPPSAAQAGYLATTISSGGGTTSLTLANSAVTTVSGATVLHDNAPALRAAMQAAFNVNGGTVYIPAGPQSGSSFVYWPFNSTLDMTSGFTNPNFSPAHILSNAFVTLNQPWILRPSLEIEGLPKKSSSFYYTPGASFGGNAHPMFYMGHGSGNSIQLNRVILTLGNAQQTGIYSDDYTDGGGISGFLMDDSEVQGTGGLSRPIIIKGGFDYFFRRSNCDAGGTTFPVPPCLQVTNSSSAVTGSNSSQVPGRVVLDGMYFAGSAMQVDNVPNALSAGGYYFQFRGSLYESGNAPFLRINFPNGGFTDQFSFIDCLGADMVAGMGTPFIDASFSGLRNVSWKDGSLTTAGQPLLMTTNTSGQNATTLSVDHAPTVVLGNANWFNIGNGYAELNGQVFSAFNSGRLIYQLGQPAAPTVSVGSGGSVPVGTIPYQITAVDADGKETLVGPAANAVTTSGNQTVTVTAPALPAGAVGWYPYRQGARGNIPGVSGGCANPIPASITQWVDTFSFTCGNSVPNVASAGSSILSSNGVSSYRFTLNGEPFTASPRGPLNVFFPGALTSTWTGETWTLDKAITVTRVQVQAKAAPSGCATNAVVRLTDGTTAQDVTISAAANDSGAITKNYAAGAVLTLSVQTAAAGCATAPADANAVVQFKMQ